MKKRLKYFLLIVGIFILSIVVIISFSTSSTIDKWSHFKSTNGFKYSLSYPSHWNLTNCGNGEIIVTKKKINKCYYPLEADNTYLDNLYFQTFVPKKNHIVSISNIRADEYFNLQVLEEWYTSTWIERDEWFAGWRRYGATNKTVYVKSVEDSWYQLYSPNLKRGWYESRKQGERAIAVPNFHFAVRYNNNNPEIETIKRVLNTVQIH